MTPMLTGTGKSTDHRKIVTVLDVGTSKVSCFIVELGSAHREHRGFGRELPARLLGAGYHRSQGIKAGAIVDLAPAEQAIRTAVGRAERVAGLTVEDVVCSVGCGRVRSENFVANARLAQRTVSDEDIAKVMAAGKTFVERDGRTLLHLHGLGFRLDGQTGIRNPRGMDGEELKVDINGVGADEPAVRNLSLLVERCYLTLSGMYATPYASGLAVVTDEEAEIGVTCLDLGAGTTTLSIFGERQFLYCDVIAVGGDHISYDIANTLSTPLAEAERIKTLYGNLVGAASDEHEPITHTVIGDNEPGLYHTTRAQLRRTIERRVELTFDIIEDRLKQSRLEELARSRLVLTGGGAQLAGIAEYAQRRFGCQVRIAGPRPIAGMPGNLTGPQYAVSVGLLHALLAPGATAQSLDASRSSARGGLGVLGRVGQWFRDSFWDEDRSVANRA